MRPLRRLFGSRRGRSALAAVAVIAGGVLIVLPAGGAPLSGSKFESDDGNLVVDTTGNKDWANAPNLAVGDDAFQVNSDDSYKGGAKHDDVCPQAETGGIPPNKDDLTELYVGSEVSGPQNHVFLYMAWERFLSKDSSASAHLGFEFNQSTTPCPASTKSANVLRTAGDILILYDLEGGGTPSLTLMTWLTSLGAGDSCTVANSAPCWGNPHSLTAAESNGAINSTAPITDPVPNPDRTLNFTNQFGEAAVDLTATGVLQPGQCEGFGRAQLGSRSSGNSFQSTQKDFVGPIPIHVQTCGGVKVAKTDDAGNPIGGVKFKLFTDAGTTTATTGPPDGANGPHQDQHGVEDTAVSPEKSCVTDTTTGECTITEVQAGNYWVVEDKTTVPPEFDSTAADQYAVVTAGNTTDLTGTPFVNPRLHKVIVLVCHESTDSLVASDVTNGTTTKSTLAHGATLPTGVTEAKLCGLGGASFGGKGHLVNDPYAVDIGNSGGTLTDPHD